MEILWKGTNILNKLILIYLKKIYIKVSNEFCIQVNKNLPSSLSPSAPLPSLSPSDSFFPVRQSGKEPCHNFYDHFNCYILLQVLWPLLSIYSLSGLFIICLWCVYSSLRQTGYIFIPSEPVSIMWPTHLYLISHYKSPTKIQKWVSAVRRL